MLLIARILSLISPLALAGLLALLFLSVAGFYFVVSAGLLIAALSSWSLVKLTLKPIDRRGGFFYIFQIIALVAGFLLLFAFLENFWFKAALWLLISALLFFYYDNLFKIFHARLRGEEKMLVYRSLTAGLTAFCLAAGLFGLHDFIGFSIWLNVAAVFGLVFLQDWLFWKRQAQKSALVYAVCSALINAEIFWAISNLPLVYYLKGLIFALFYLALMVSLDSQLDRRWTGDRVKNYLLVIGLLILLALATARWF